VGVGTGLSLPEFPSYVHITGIDLSQEMLDRAQKRVEKHGLTNTELYCMDAMELDFPDNSFDKLIVLYVLSVVPDPYKLMREIRRVAKPGADVIFVNHFAKENPLIRKFEASLSQVRGATRFPAGLSHGTGAGKCRYGREDHQAGEPLRILDHAAW